MDVASLADLLRETPSLLHWLPAELYWSDEFLDAPELPFRQRSR